MPLDPLVFMCCYVSLCDSLFPFHPELWLTSIGVVPTTAWFTSCLTSILGPDVGGHSIHSGAATSHALAGVPDNIIQGMGCWSSHTFKLYIYKHPVILQALIVRATLERCRDCTIHRLAEGKTKEWIINKKYNGGDLTWQRGKPKRKV